MSLVIQKYGGSSLADYNKVMNAAEKIVDKFNRGNEVVVVVSAQGNTTDELIQKAKMFNDRPLEREMDVLLSTGEQVSMALMAIAIRSLGVPAISLTGMQAGILTSNDYSNSMIKEIDTSRIKKELAKGQIVIVAGFQGVNEFGDITTLGRGGSDTTAVALAAKLDAIVCEIYTDVDGVYTADPKIVKNAKKMDFISYDDMLEMASLGAKVLHNRSVELAKKYNVNLVVKSSFNNNSGTLVKEISNMEGLGIAGITKDDKVSKITVHILEKKPGRAYELFKILAEKNIGVDIIIQAVHNDEEVDIGFTTARSDLEFALKELEENKEKLGIYKIEQLEDISKVSIIGTGMMRNLSITAQMFQALFEAEIDIHAISKSESKISVLVDKKDGEKAINVLHQRFIR